MENCACGKVCYPTRDAAREKTEALRQKRNRAKIYRCPDSHAFHLTTKKKKAAPYDRKKQKFRPSDFRG